MNTITPIQLPFAADERGFFQKLFTADHPILSQFEIKQANRVGTVKKRMLRGLHYQSEPFAEAKLFSVLHGKIQLAAFCVDSKNDDFKMSHEFELTPSSNSVYVPRGYATGYLALENDTEVIYFSDNAYSPKAEKGIKWNDPVLTILWHCSEPILSKKDNNWPPFDAT